MNAPTGELLQGRLRRVASRPNSLPLIGLTVFTFFLVTARWSDIFTEAGIYVALLGLLIRPGELRFPVPLRWATAFLIWAAVTAVFAISPEIARDALIEWLKALVIFFVVVNTLRTPKQLRFYVLVILVAFLIYPARGTLKGYLMGNTVFGRAIWNKIYANPNDLAAITMLTMGLALAIATVKAQSARIRRAAALCVPVMLLIILLTQSRGAFIGLMVGFGPAVLARLRKRPSAAAPILVVICVVAALVPAASWHRLESISNLTDPQTNPQTVYEAVAEGSAEQRLQILKTAWHIFVSNPVLGVGIGCYNEANARYAPELGERDAHNTYLRLAAEMGLPGLLLWLGLVGSVLAQVRRRRASLEADIRTIEVLWIERAIIGCLVAGFFASYAGITLFYLFLGTLWAAAKILGSAPAAAASARPRRPAPRSRRAPTVR